MPRFPYLLKAAGGIQGQSSEQHPHGALIATVIVIVVCIHLETWLCPLERGTGAKEGLGETPQEPMTSGGSDPHPGAESAKPPPGSQPPSLSMPVVLAICP